MHNDVVLINLDRPRELRYGHKALKHLVALTGKSLEEVEEAFGDTSNLEVIEQVVYCGLLNDAKRNGENLQLTDMEDLLDHAPSFAHIIERMQQAFFVSFGVQQQVEAQVGNQPMPEESPAKESPTTGKSHTE